MARAQIAESKAWKYFERNARYLKENSYVIRIGYSSTAFYANDTESLWNKFWDYAKKNPTKIV